MKFGRGKHIPYKSAQQLRCKVVKKDLQGYAVKIVDDEFDAFLDTRHDFQVGEELLARFIAVHPNGRILLFYNENID